MSYASLVRRGIDKAFSLSQDLAQTVTLTQKNSTKYNFGDNSIDATVPVVKSVKCILLSKKKPKSDSKVPMAVTSQFLFKAADLTTPDIYDTITTASGELWTCVPPCQTDGYLITIDAVRSS